MTKCRNAEFFVNLFCAFVYPVAFHIIETSAILTNLDPLNV